MVVFRIWVVTRNCNLYSNLEFGNQIWTNKNLIVKHYKNGDPIPFIEDREECEE